jgi:hypothetical protein
MDGRKGKVRMRVFGPRWFLVLSVLAVAGCQDKPSPSTATPADVEADIRVNLARLGPEDQRVAEQQKYCPLMEGVRLGEMGRPCKVTVKGVSAFVCCENCARAAQDEPDRALAQIRELKQARAQELAAPPP